MKPHSDPSDPFREMLHDDARNLPAMAAQAAREFRARRARRRRRLAQAALIALLGACFWPIFQFVRPVPKGGGLANNVIQQPGPVPPRNVAMVLTTEEALAKPLPPPPGTTQQQRELLEAARGLPLLLVMDAPGKPPRIVVVER